MKDTESVHKKIQEMCDCYADNDPLTEMSLVNNETDIKEAAVKWLALAALHGMSSNAKKLTIRKSRDGNVSVTAEYRDKELPSPGSEVGSEIFEAVRSVTHIEDKKGKSYLALGLRDSSIDLKVKVSRKEDKEKVSFEFPEA